MKRIEITELADGNRIISGVTDIYEDCPLVVKAGDRSWHALNYGQECTFRVTITGPGDVSVWRGNELVLPEPESEPEVEAKPKRAKKA